MCQGSYVLLINSSTWQIAAYNPLTRALDILPLPDEISNGFRGKFIRLDFVLLSSEEAPGSFHVIAFYYGISEMRATIFSSNTMDWRILTLSEPAMAQPSRKICTDQLLSGMLLNGSVYWPHKKKAYMLVVDTATLQLSYIDLPAQLEGQGDTYMIGETKDEKLCIVSMIGDTYIVRLVTEGKC